MNLSMLFSTVKIIAIIQVILVVILLLFAYGLKLYVSVQQNRAKKIAQRLRLMLLKAMKDPRHFIPTPTKLYKNNQTLLLEIINEFDAETAVHYKNWAPIRHQLIESIVLPNARRYAKSRRWGQRYLACQSFKLSLQAVDEPILKRLIHDPIPIISIHAALFAVNYNSQSLVDAVISYFAKGRRIQQSLYAQFISNKSPSLEKLFHHRLNHETDPYIKIFCYRTLSHPEFTSKPIKLAFTDAQSSHLDLQLAAMVYLYHHDPASATPLFLTFLTHEQWEVRAKAAKLLGKIGHATFAVPLETCLHDKVWWVRMNAAEALAALGEPGLAMLKKQTHGNDLYARDVAMAVLNARRSERS
ncbi:MAG: HEAT repeat domain-containing protein [Gammaproteobacteria bacterium]|nr:HEAT repeat domain-containing protein [Gammaproteobacteria bacterium]